MMMLTTESFAFSERKIGQKEHDSTKRSDFKMIKSFASNLEVNVDKAIILSAAKDTRHALDT